MIYDQGDVVPLGITITDATGALANAGSVSCTITLPDGTTTSGSVVNASTGLYNVDFTPTQVGRYQVKWLATGANASAFADEFTVRDYSKMGVVSLAQLKEHLNIPATTTANDEELRRMMDAANDLAEGYVGLILGRQTFTSEVYDGGVEFIRLLNPCAINVISVYENGVLVDSSGYKLDSTGQRLLRVGSISLGLSTFYSTWAMGVSNIVVSYVAGYVNPPPAAVQGVLELCRHLWETQRGAMKVISRGTSGDDFYPASTYSLPRRVMELLDPVSLPGMA